MPVSMKWFRRAQAAQQQRERGEQNVFQTGDEIPWPYPPRPPPKSGRCPDCPQILPPRYETPAQSLDRKICAWEREDMLIFIWDENRNGRLLKIGQLLLKRFNNASVFIICYM